MNTNLDMKKCKSCMGNSAFQRGIKMLFDFKLLNILPRYLSILLSKLQTYGIDIDTQYSNLFA